MMKAVDDCLRRVDIISSVVELLMTDNTVRRYPLKKVHEYANNKPSVITAVGRFQDSIDQDHWFSKTGREPTLRILANEYTRAIKADLDSPLTILSGLFMPDGVHTPYNGWVLLDGAHRLLKCLMTGRGTVSVVELTITELRTNVVEID